MRILKRCAFLIVLLFLAPPGFAQNGDVNEKAKNIEKSLSQIYATVTQLRAEYLVNTGYDPDLIIGQLLANSKNTDHISGRGVEAVKHFLTFAQSSMIGIH